MSKEWLINSKQIIESVESTLQSAYEENDDIHERIDGDQPIEIKSLNEDRGAYKLEKSEILFWVDRNAYYEEMEFCLLKHHEEAIEYLKQNDLKPIFKDFVEAIKKKRIVPFIGAGLSFSSGFPLWGKALHDISRRIEGIDYEDVDNKLADLEYFDVAQILWEAEDAQFKTYIRNKFSANQLSEQGPVGAINCIDKLSEGCIVTTNFDGLIEKVIGKGNLEGYMHGMQQGNKFVSKLIKGERCILKLHGDAEDWETYVFTNDQYDEAYGQPIDFSKPLPKSLRQIYVTSSLIFLGCSLEKDRTLDLFEDVSKDSNFVVPDHFALLPEPVSDAEESKNSKDGRLNNLNIRTIWYPEGKHEFVEKYLNLALDMASERLRDF